MAATAERKLIPFPQRRREEREFLPAALEIVETPVSPTGRIMMGVVCLLVLVAVGWACVGRLDIVATATARLVPSGQIKLIQPLEIGVVKRIAVTDGDRVAAGDVLVELDTTSNLADRDRLTRNVEEAILDISRLNAFLAKNVDAFKPPAGTDPALAGAKRQQLVAQLQQQGAKLDGLDQQIMAKIAECDQAVAKIAKLDASIPLLQDKARIYDQLVMNQLSSRIAMLDAERQLSEAKYDRVTTLHQKEGAEAQIAALTQQRKEAEEEFRRQALDELGKVTHYAAEQREELVKAQQRAAFQVLRAPVNGTVEQLAVHTIGGVVTPAQTLMVVVPNGSALEVEAILPNRDAGFVHAGQPAELKVEAFNYTRYGLLHGQVRNVSRDALRNERDAPNPERDQTPGKSSQRDAQNSPPPETGYVARVSLSETSIDTEEGTTPLEAGMVVSAEIKTGERSVISYLLSPLMRYRHEALRER